MTNNKKSNTTLADKAVTQIKGYISTMNLKENSKLPREELLAEIIGVSRVTLRSALNTLASEGIIFRKHGSGTYVNTNYFSITTSISQLLEYTEVIRLNGYKPSMEYLDLSIIEAGKKFGKILNLKEDDKVIKSEKLFFADKSPCIYCKDFFPLSSLEGKKNLEDIAEYKNSIFKFFADNYNRQLIWDKIILGATNSFDTQIFDKYYSKEVAEKKTFLTFNTEAYDQNNELILFAEEFIDPEVIQFSAVRQRTV